MVDRWNEWYIWFMLDEYLVEKSQDYARGTVVAHWWKWDLAAKTLQIITNSSTFECGCGKENYNHVANKSKIEPYTTCNFLQPKGKPKRHRQMNNNIDFPKGDDVN